MINKLYFMLLSVCAIILTGCGTVSHIPLDKKASASVKTIYINPVIHKPEKMYEFVSGAEYGFAFGALGGATSGIMMSKAAETTQQFVEKNHINITKIVYNTWVNEINRQSHFKLSNQPTDAILTTDIVVYGISIPYGFSTDYVPVMTLNAKLVRNNQTIWQDSGRVLPLSSGMPRYKMNEMTNDPTKFQVLWEKAAVRIIGEMVQDMNK